MTGMWQAVTDQERGPQPPADQPSGSGCAVTEQLISSAATRGARIALTGEPGTRGYTYAELAETVQRAGAGLAWRGVRPRDVVGVYVPDAESFVLACHAIRAAGGIPSPVSSERSIAEIAGQLADCGARMLVTAPPLAAAGQAAADRCWVRQIISFGDAPGAMPFADLLGMGTMRPPGCRAQDLALLPYGRPPDGGLQPDPVTHQDMHADLAGLAADAGLGEHDVVLAGPPVGGGRDYACVLDHALLGGASVVAAGADDFAAAAGWHQPTAVVVPDGVPVAADGPRRVFTVRR
jgi:non-ribosomal peptide synthetase component F